MIFFLCPPNNFNGSSLHKHSKQTCPKGALKGDIKQTCPKGDLKGDIKQTCPKGDLKGDILTEYPFKKTETSHCLH